MRALISIPILMLIMAPGPARSDASDTTSAAEADRNEARWADWEVQARITEGDYDGAVQAQQRADAERAKAHEQELAAGATKRR